MDELYHYGVKGQKWGIRRYQKKDGSLTEIGKQRYKPTKADTEKYGIRGAKRIAKHRNQGMSKEEARKKENRIFTAKALGIFTLPITVPVGALTLRKVLDSKKAQSLIDSAKKVIDSYNNVKILDKQGNVISSRHYKMGKDIVETILGH